MFMFVELKAEVHVKPRPADFNSNLGAQDPRRGRYAKDFGPPYSRLCKEVRNRLIEDIIKKHKMLRTASDREKAARRKQFDEKRKEKSKKKKKKKKRIIASKLKKKVCLKQNVCSTCGDLHLKRGTQCKLRDLRVRIMVQQILQNSQDIKANMSQVWKNLEYLESTYEQFFLKTHRIQSNRVCLGDLTGKDFPGEKHPFACPCVLKQEKERLDAEIQEKRREEEERRREELAKEERKIKQDETR
ncbi:uncharacterized protein LOC111711421 [Eurytemora carolleeae]|uniref:uncharacterized protein LOC111711421 n=1 Tax=Eurytemora carolleeae TaxID=1294199 RepID=UPI000C76600E|nr:uncharacterized protein LOC111711421 [Eurytemora carolleeae]|eukprot:XP_023341552.1 uncharacterized protein LOC111711421 [Eurytemora affinis]